MELTLPHVCPDSVWAHPKPCCRSSTSSCCGSARMWHASSLARATRCVRGSCLGAGSNSQRKLTTRPPQQLAGKTDARFVEGAFRLFRESLGVKTVLQPSQFLSQVRRGHKGKDAVEGTNGAEHRCWVLPCAGTPRMPMHVCMGRGGRGCATHAPSSWCCAATCRDLPSARCCCAM